MRELVYYIATTLDGFIAREDGAFDEFPWDEGYLGHLLALYPETFPAHLRRGPVDRAGNARFDTVLMGRKTYEVGLEHDIASPYPTLDQFVFSTTMTESPSPDVVLVSDDAVAATTDLKRRDGGPIWLCGGSQLATSLLEAGLIDEVVIKLNPVIFGDGIPLFAHRVDAHRLRLKSSRPLPSGHVLLSYAVTG